MLPKILFSLSVREQREHIASAPSGAGFKTKRSPLQAARRLIFNGLFILSVSTRSPAPSRRGLVTLLARARTTSRNRADRRCTQTSEPDRWICPSEREVESEACSHQVATVVSMVVGRSDRLTNPPHLTDQEACAIETVGFWREWATS